MKYPGPSLHPAVLRTEAEHHFFRNRVLPPATQQKLPVPRPVDDKSISLPLTTVAQAGRFDAYINISFPGADGALSPDLLVDSGNTCLILPDYAALAALPGFTQNYKILERDTKEPWGCPARKLRGPIRIPTTEKGKFYDIPDCIFYACTGSNGYAEPTANFGTGCLAPRKIGDNTIRSPLALSDEYSYAVYDFAAATKIHGPRMGSMNIGAGDSFLTLYKDMPDGYRHQIFEIVPNQLWMSLRPKRLSIDGKETKWPGKLAASSIAMVDTGGGPVFLSDPEKYVWADDWPAPARLPAWIGGDDGSYSCQATRANLSITLSDGHGEFSYHVETAKLPDQSLTLVMCKQCYYMEENPHGVPQNGMNIGGLSACVNYILIDYARARVGLKAKHPDLV